MSADERVPAFSAAPRLEMRRLAHRECVDHTRETIRNAASTGQSGTVTVEVPGVPARIASSIVTHVPSVS